MAPGLPPRPEAIFVADHLALDFLNSRSTPSGVWMEWLENGRDLVDWLERAGAIEADVAAEYRGDGGACLGLDDIAERARGLREWFRGFVSKRAGKELGAEAVAELGPLNRLLARSDSYEQVVAAVGDDGASRALELHRRRRWTDPEQLLMPIAEAMADLICREDFRLIRACDGSACTLLFLDRTKSHARRWCSMAVCGNRAKAAAHRARAGRRRA